MPVEVLPAGDEEALPRLMSIAEAAIYFDRTPRTINRWIAGGSLSVMRVGRAKFIRLDDVQRLIVEQIVDRALIHQRSIRRASTAICDANPRTEK